MISLNKPFTSEFNPVPKMASTMRHAVVSSLFALVKFPLESISANSPSMFTQIRRFARASPRTLSLLVSRNTFVLIPQFIRCLAITNPSPPLLPWPARTATHPVRISGKERTRGSAAPLPAFSIKSIPGMPYSWMVLRSRSHLAGGYELHFTPLIAHGRPHIPVHGRCLQKSPVSLFLGRSVLLYPEPSCGDDPEGR